MSSEANTNNHPDVLGSETDDRALSRRYVGANSNPEAISEPASGAFPTSELSESPRKLGVVRRTSAPLFWLRMGCHADL